MVSLLVKLTMPKPAARLLATLAWIALLVLKKKIITLLNQSYTNKVLFARFVDAVLENILHKGHEQHRRDAEI